MKKKNKILLGLSGLCAMTLLASCGAKEITDSAELTDLMIGIVEKKAEVKNYWMTATGKETVVDKATKEEKVTNDEMFLRMNEDGEEQVYMTSQSGAIVENLYLVNDETYEKLIYCDHPYMFNGKTTVIDRRTHKSEFDNAFTQLFESGNNMVDTFLDPNRASSLVQRLHTDTAIFQTKTRYFSSKNGQLTVKVDEVSAVKDDDTTNYFEFNYEDFVFKGAKYTHKYSTEEYIRTFEYAFDFKVMNKVTITLPSSWEGHLITEE